VTPSGFSAVFVFILLLDHELPRRWAAFSHPNTFAPYSNNFILERISIASEFSFPPPLSGIFGATPPSSPFLFFPFSDGTSDPLLFLIPVALDYVCSVFWT